MPRCIDAAAPQQHGRATVRAARRGRTGLGGLLWLACALPGLAANPAPTGLTPARPGAAAPPAAAPASRPVAAAPAQPVASAARLPDGADKADKADQAAAVEPRTAALSSTGQRVYQQARRQLLQVRTLLKTQDSQSSVGSGFLVSNDGHLITNYHVVSQYALRPDRHRLVFVDADGAQGALQLLAFDVAHDLALLKPAQAGALAGRGAVSFRPAEQAMPRGARMYALGNPLDVGFAVNEGSYNGPVERSFLTTLFFGGALSPGMSGGPALDEQGRLVGVNVATRMGGEQVSFLVPAGHAEALLQRGRTAQPITQAAWPELTRQLTAHQALLTERFLAQPWRSAGHPRYRIPVPQETFLRCWGDSSAGTTRGLRFERSDCEMDSRVFVSDALLMGALSVRHEVYDGSRLGALRFAERHAASFGNESFGVRTAQLTGPRCHERTVERQGLPLRAVLCLSAYKKLPGLYNLGVLVATLDQSDAGAQGRFDAVGVSFDNAMRLAQHYLDGYQWTAPPTASP